MLVNPAALIAAAILSASPEAPAIAFPVPADKVIVTAAANDS